MTDSKERCHTSRLVASFLVLMSAVSAPLASAQPEGGAVRDCHRLYRLTDINYAVEPGVWVEAADSVPVHCRLRGVVNRAIRVEVTLPANWNGRMMFSTVGGNAGMFGDTRSLLSQGFAMATTDTGHEGPGPEFLLQPEALLDFAYRGVHLATIFAKQVIARYYGREVDRAYLQGCSNGGRAALMEALRFPDDYDGIIAGAPAFRLQEFNPWTLHVHRAQQANPLDHESLKTLGAASRKSCDLLDGVEDGVINDPRRCTKKKFDLTKLECAKGETSGCLTTAQIQTARTMYTDLVDADGSVLSPGVLPGAEDGGDWAVWLVGVSEYNAAVGLEEGPLNGLVVQNFENLLHPLSVDVDTFDPIADRDKFDNVARYMDVNNADLSEFRARGGKLLMYQGWNDYPLRPQRAIDYLHKVETVHGGQSEAQEFFRLFMVPGMGHCGGGPGAWVTDYVEPLVNWVENGEAPEKIVGSSADGVFSRPQCVYPKLAKYAGGPKTEWSSFSCQ